MSSDDRCRKSAIIVQTQLSHIIPIQTKGRIPSAPLRAAFSSNFRYFALSSPAPAYI